jgi:hypothetical protein
VGQLERTQRLAFADTVPFRETAPTARRSGMTALLPISWDSLTPIMQMLIANRLKFDPVTI